MAESTTAGPERQVPSTLRSQIGPFVIIPLWVVTHPDISPSALRVYAVLASFANQRHACWPGKERIADDANLSRNTVDEALKQLADAGMLTVRPRYDDEGRQTTNHYHLVQMDPRPPQPDHPPKNWEGGPPQDLGAELDPEGTRSKEKDHVRPAPATALTVEANPIRVVLATYDHLFAERYHDRPDIGTKEAALAQRLIKKHGLDAVLLRLRQFFTDPDPFFAEGGHMFGVFSACWTKIVAHASSNGTAPVLISDTGRSNIVNAEAALAALDKKPKALPPGGRR